MQWETHLPPQTPVFPAGGFSNNNISFPEADQYQYGQDPIYGQQRQYQQPSASYPPPSPHNIPNRGPSPYGFRTQSNPAPSGYYGNEPLSHVGFGGQPTYHTSYSPPAHESGGSSRSGPMQASRGSRGTWALGDAPSSLHITLPEPSPQASWATGDDTGYRDYNSSSDFGGFRTPSETFSPSPRPLSAFPTGSSEQSNRSSNRPHDIYLTPPTVHHPTPYHPSPNTQSSYPDLPVTHLSNTRSVSSLSRSTHQSSPGPRPIPPSPSRVSSSSSYQSSFPVTGGSTFSQSPPSYLLESSSYELPSNPLSGGYGPPPPLSLSQSNRYQSGGSSYPGAPPVQESSYISTTGSQVFIPQPSGPAFRPPENPQSFDTPSQTPGGSNEVTSYQYSQCTGNKRALCIGINYQGNAKLGGCINDANKLKAFIMEKYSYEEQHIVVLTDDSEDPKKLPTRYNIIKNMRRLVQGAQPNDSLFFHFSGHGGQMKDNNGDEADGFDEVIHPVDWKEAGHITDDEMHDIMVKSLPAGCRLTAIFDACCSGSVLDLPYIYSTEGKLKETSGVFKVIDLIKNPKRRNVVEFWKTKKSSPADVISWTGCKDSQTAADTHIAGQATGAMTHAFITALNYTPEQTYQELLINIRQILKDKYSQKPQLSSSHPIDTNILFIV